MRNRRALFSLGVISLFVIFALYANEQTEPNRPVTQNRELDKEALSRNDDANFLARNEELDRFADVEMLQRERNIRVKDDLARRMINDIIGVDGAFFPDWYWTVTMDTLVTSLGKRRSDSGDYTLRSTRDQSETTSEGWDQMDSHIRQYSLYNPSDPAIEDVLHRMATSRLETTKANNEGYHLKVDVKFVNGGWAVLKIMRLPRNISWEENKVNERHHAEIAAFHLDRLFGYYRVPPTVGRFLNLRTELYPVLPANLRRTFFKTTDGRMCLYGDCKSCGKQKSYCGSPETTEVSLMYYLPDKTHLQERPNPFHTIPWKKPTEDPYIRQSYYCNKTRLTFTEGDRFLLEILDTRYFDFLIDNFDRHHYATYAVFKNDTIPFLYDNSRGFGSPTHDRGKSKPSLNWYHRCCIIKKSTFLKYLKLFVGSIHLSDLMRESLRTDPVNPVLTKDDLKALDNRVRQTIDFVYDCLLKARFKIEHVILDDTE